MSDKLKIIDHVKNGAKKASISQKYGTPKGIIRSWTKEEHKFWSFVAIESEVELQRKKIKLGAVSELYEYLHRWLLTKRGVAVPLLGSIVRFQAAKFNHYLCSNNNCFASNC